MSNPEQKIPTDYDAYLNGLPIPREPDTTHLTDEDIEKITNVVFAPSEVSASDLLFIFGTSATNNHIYRTIAIYYQQGFFPHVLVTGLVGRAYYQTGKPLAIIMRDGLIEHGIPPHAISVQSKSTNTYEDVVLSLNLINAHSPLQTISFLSKSHHSGRCLRTLRKQFPDLTLHAITYDAEYDGVKISRGTWHQTQTSRSRVYGEYLRIKKYASKGDIAF